MGAMKRTRIYSVGARTAQVYTTLRGRYGCIEEWETCGLIFAWDGEV